MPDNTNRIKEDLKRRAGEFLTNKLGCADRSAISTMTATESLRRKDRGVRK